jgi:hypothetical protein
MYNGTTGKKIFDAFNIQGGWNNKKARGANTHQGHLYRPTIMC